MSRHKSGRFFLFAIGLALTGMIYAPAILAQGKIFNQLVEMSKAEMGKKGGKLSFGNNWTPRQAKPVLKEFTKDFPFVKEVIFTRMRTVDFSQRMLLEYKSGRSPEYDVPMVTTEAWSQYEEAGAFLKPPFGYKELIKARPANWPAPDPRVVDPKGFYMYTAGSARGIAYNKNLVPKDKAPKGWDDCLDPMWRGKLIYDPRPKLTGLWYDPKTREMHVKWLKGLMKNGVTLNRGMSENLMKLIAGEFQVNCGANYHNAMPLIDDGAPLEFFFPDPFPIDFSSQIHVVKWSKTPGTAQLLALWLASKAQALIDKVSYRGFPWDTSSRKYPMAKNKYVAICAADCSLELQEYAKVHAKILKLPGVKRR